MTWRRVPVLLLLAVMLMGQGAGGVGLFIRSDCTTLTAPVTGQSWCFDATAQLPKVWNGASWAQSPPTPVANIVAGTSRLTYVSGTALQLGLGVIPLKVSGTWIMRPITTVVSCNNTGLADSTTYFVYMYDAPGTTCTISATGHSTDSAYGVETLTGDATRTLVGMVRTNASTHQFEDDNALRGVLSFYARRGIGLVQTFTADRATTSTTFVELNTEIRGNALTWGDESVFLSITGTADNTTPNGQVATAVGVDSTTVAQTGFESGGLTVAAANQGVPIGIAGPINGLSEGFHFFALLGATSGGTTGNWRTADSLTNARLKTAVLVGVRG